MIRLKKESDKMLKFQLDDQTEITCKEGSTVLEFIQSQKDADQIYAITINGKLHDLNSVLTTGGKLSFIYADSETGKMIYERSLNFLFIAAVKSIFPNAKVRMEYAFSRGQYCEIDQDGYLKPSDVEAIKQKMDELVKACEPIQRRIVKKEEAISFFRHNQMDTKADLLVNRESETCSIYTLHNCDNYFYGIMLPNTSYLTHYSLRFYSPGIWLSPQSHFENQAKLFHVFHTFEDWGRLMGVSNVAQLNKKIQQGNMDALVLISETMIEKKLAELADSIVKDKPLTKFILIAGPSSAGKTTFSRRLAIHLRILGKKPIPISMDDFFKNRIECPKLPDGTYDFEGLGALDLDLFNETMLKLMHKEEVRMPIYNFKTGKREWKEKTTKLDDDSILIIEGIHGLNPKTSMDLPEEAKYRIYINALTHLNLDEHNRIPTSDYRLIRRIVRDYQFRGWDAKETIHLWKNVNLGEANNIYPYQEEADVIFNTSMVYEMAILKGLVKPLLDKIQPDEEEYLEANRLNKMLQYFVEGSADAVPRSSILAEFIGNSVFDV